MYVLISNPTGCRRAPRGWVLVLIAVVVYIHPLCYAFWVAYWLWHDEAYLRLKTYIVNLLASEVFTSKLFELLLKSCSWKYNSLTSSSPQHEGL
jgi:hypothetical protein